jgi:2-polyprenyl-3-methyl-5-hydroxy-6-metoxy-1,4-benzoquinol methylase
MTVREDPENNELRALTNIADLDGKNVLEVGCGDGRLTWRYARKTASVVAIEPFEPSIQQAWKNMPGDLNDRVDLHHIGFEDFVHQHTSASFDIVILSWSL